MTNAPAPVHTLPSRGAARHFAAPPRLDHHTLQAFAAGDQPACPRSRSRTRPRAGAPRARDHRAGHQPDLASSASMPLRIRVADLAHRRPLARRPAGERRADRARGMRPCASGIGWPCGSSLGMAGQPVDRRQHPVADVVLEHLGILVDLGPVEPQHLDQERSRGSGAGAPSRSPPATLGGQPRAGARRVRDQPLRGRAAEHVGDRRRRDREPRGELEVDTLVAAGRERVERLEVVLPRARERRAVRALASSTSRESENTRQWSAGVRESDEHTGVELVVGAERVGEPAVVR